MSHSECLFLRVLFIWESLISNVCAFLSPHHRRYNQSPQLSISLSLSSDLIIWLFSDRNCGIEDPSWAELRYFVNFLNSQLQACEESSFCNMDLVGDTLEGFRSFVVRFMILMSRVSS